MAMSGSNSSTPELRRWIVLIGIDYYLPGSARFDDNNRPMVFTNLQGCVRDVRKVQDYFRMQPTADTCRITTFTSSNPQEESTNRPTYENIVQSLKTITYEAEPGDIVHIHYSGHGARVWTSYRGRNDLFTAAIVPLDIAREEGKYLLTDELSDLLDDMVDKRLNVTMVLDSCYSGKSDRHRNHSISGFRGISQIDATESSIHPRSTIQVAPTQSYELSAGRGCKVLLDMQKGYELLTACRNNETASEHNFAGEHHGLLTYNLLDSLKCSGSNFTHGMLHRRLVILVNQINPAQTPVFAGESQRFFLSSNRVESQLIPTISIKHIEGNNLILGAGEAQGMFVGAEMPVYPWDTSDFNNSGLQPKVRVIDVNPTESKAKCIEPHIENCQIQPGSLAVPPKSLGRRFAVKLLEPSMSTEKDMFDRLKTETESSKNLYSPVKLIPGSSGNAAYHIRVDNDQYRLLNTANEPIRGFPSSALPELFFNYLEHLAQYEILRDLQSPNEMSEEMITKFKFELEVEGSGKSSALQPDAILVSCYFS
jgi:hypothetical protein